jgi:hypothetical protein
LFIRNVHGRDMDEIPLRPDGLQLDEDRRFQERFWTVERFAWGGFGIVIAAALAGLTGGGGPLANASRALGDATIEYPVITRWTTADKLTVHLPPAEVPTILLGPRLLDVFEIESIQPHPSASITTPEGLKLEFRADGAGTAPVTIVLQSDAVGRVSFDVSVAEAGTARLTTLVMP